MKAFLLTVWLFFLSNLQLCAQTVSVTGYLKDAVSGAALQGANDYSKSERYGQTTDNAGFFKFHFPPHKPIELIFSYVGYTTQTHLLSPGQDTLLVIKMVQDNRLPDVQVYAPRRDFGVNNSQMSAVELPVAQVKA